MPFRDRWSARIRQPGQFDRIRTELDAFGAGIDVVWGIKGNKAFVQAIRFDSDKFDRADVTKWLREHEDSQTGKPYKAISIEAPLKEGSIGTVDPVVAFSMAGSWTPIGAQEIRDGAVHQRFKKELIQVGQYEHNDGSGFEVTRKDLQNWARVSKKMHDNGVRIPVTAGPVPHEDVGNPQNSIGTVEDEFVEGDSLFVILDIVGEDNIENALANDVSIFSPVEFTDGKGRIYEQPITHVAITPTPLVPGLEGWQIAASLKQGGDMEGSVIPFKPHTKADEGVSWDGAKEVKAADVDDLKLMCAWYDADNAENKGAYKLPHHRQSDKAVVWRAVAAAMTVLLGGRGGVDIPANEKRGVYNHLAKHYKQFDKEMPDFRASLEAAKGKGNSMWKKIARALGLDTEKINDENAVDKILAGIKELKQSHKDELKEAKKSAKKASLEDEDVKAAIDEEIEKQVKAKTVEIKAALSGDKPEPDEMMVDVVVDNRAMKINGLFEGCRITADVQKAITERYGKKDAIAASMKLGENGDTFKFWMGILAKNNPVELTEKTGAQVIKAALQKPEDADRKAGEAALLADADRRVEAAKK